MGVSLFSSNEQPMIELSDVDIEVTKRKLEENVAYVTFQKVDGTKRSLLCTRSTYLISKLQGQECPHIDVSVGDRMSEVDHEKGYINVYDIAIRDYRKFSAKKLYVLKYISEDTISEETVKELISNYHVPTVSPSSSSTGSSAPKPPRKQSNGVKLVEYKDPKTGEKLKVTQEEKMALLYGGDDLETIRAKAKARTEEEKAKKEEYARKKAEYDREQAEIRAAADRYVKSEQFNSNPVEVGEIDFNTGEQPKKEEPKLNSPSVNPNIVDLDDLLDF